MSLSSFSLDSGGFIAADSHPPYNMGIGDFTVESWVKTMHGGTIISRKSSEGGYGNGGFLLVVNPDGTIKLATDNGIGFFEQNTIPSSICDGIWHHVAAVRKGDSISIYLDGSLQEGQYRGNASPPLNVSNTDRLTIGSTDQEQEPHRNFTGNLAEVRLWNYARTSSDISSYRSLRLPPEAAGLVGYWSAEFGLLHDFSNSRNPTISIGSVSFSTDTPAVEPGNAPPTLYLFRGEYDTAARAKDSMGSWQSAEPLYITSMGFVVLGSEVLTNVTIKGNSISWSSPFSSGYIRFQLKSDDPYYWPEGKNDRYNFEGCIQKQNSILMDYRGTILPQSIGSGILLNIGTGYVLRNPNTSEGMSVMLAPKLPQEEDHYCLYDDNQILHLKSGLALRAPKNMNPGSPVFFDAHNDKEDLQKWILGTDGLIRLKINPNMAIGLEYWSTNLFRMVLMNANPSDSYQQFITLENSQFIWNSNKKIVLSGNLSANGACGKVSSCTKGINDPGQLWYAVGTHLICAANAWALTVTGPATPNASLTLKPLNLYDPLQNFIFQNNCLLHLSSGLPVKMTKPESEVILSRPDDIDENAVWAISPKFPNNTYSKSSAARELKDKDVSYIIKIWTGDYMAAGTDDKVEIAINGEWHCTDFIELKHSETHTNPFERGNMDRFTVTVPNCGKIKGVYIRYGFNVWFYHDRWVVDSILLYDPTTLITYSSDQLGNGMQYEMAESNYISLYFSSQGSGNSTLSVGKAPTQDDLTKGWVDHTWGVITDNVSNQTFFDAAGGHGGDGTVDNIVSGKILLNDAVRMATGYPIDSDHPYKSVYGHNDVEGRETCGIRASGYRNWDGQCHQILNRLLHVCTPSASLDDVQEDKRPQGYGLSVLMFGRYGVGFPKWCLDHKFPVPPDKASSLFDFVQRKVGDRDKSDFIAYAVIDMREVTEQDPQSPYGEATRVFFRSTKNYGISNTTMSNLVCLPEEKINELQK